MLEHVALGQGRFATPGVAPDSRGVALGRFGVLQFSTLEGVVSWFRLYSAESSLDELQNGLRIERVTNALRSREMLVRIPAVSSHAMDRASRCAELVGGQTFTGTSVHFVRYRDRESPYGYDVADLGPVSEGISYILHGLHGAQSYRVDGAIDFAKLLFRLSLRRVHGRERPVGGDERDHYLTIRRGLGDGVVRYLWRNRIDAELALVASERTSAFAEAGAREPFFLLRARGLPERMVELFRATPGVEVFRLETENVAVELGYRHLLDLASCAGVFPIGSFYLFSGERDMVDTLAGPLQFSAIGDLTEVDLSATAPKLAPPLSVEAASEAVGVAIRLVPSVTPSRQVGGSWIHPAQAPWLKRLVYLLPQSTLRGHRIAVTERGILVIADRGIDSIPLGTLLSELAPGLYIPLGMELVPRVSPEVLAQTLSQGAGTITVFPDAAAPLTISEAALAPLERRALAALEVPPLEAADLHSSPSVPPRVVNESVGRFALWGFSSPEG